MKQTKYYYKDSEGNIKRYRGNVIEENGKFYGTLIETKNSEKIAELTKETKGLKEINREIIKAWKDKYGIEHFLTNEDNVIDNEVIKYYEQEIPLIFTPAIEDKIYFTYFDKQLKRNVIYNGEVIEENGKYFGLL